MRASAAKKRPLARKRAPKLASPHNAIKQRWDQLHGSLAGRREFSAWLSHEIPYTGSIGAQVEILAPGFAQVALKDSPPLRNHLASLHAIALANLAELTGNLALAYSLPDGARFIVKSLTIEYLKKARGSIVAQCQGPIPATAQEADYDLHVALRNVAQEDVARATLLTRVGPIPRP